MAEDGKVPEIACRECGDDSERREELRREGAVTVLRLVADRSERLLTLGTPRAKTVEDATQEAIDGLRRIADRIERDGMPGGDGS